MTAFNKLGDTYFSRISTWLSRRKKAIPIKSLVLRKNTNVIFTLEWQGYPDLQVFKESSSCFIDAFCYF